MTFEEILKELLIYKLRQKLNKIKQDLEPLEKPPPDLKILSYGITIGYLDILTEKEISQSRVEKWREIISKGDKLILIVSKEQKLEITELLWKEGIAEKISIGTYEINLFLP